MNDQQTALTRIRQLRWLVPLLAILLMVWLEVYYLFEKDVPPTKVALDLIAGSAIALSLTWIAFSRVLRAQQAAATRSRELSAFNLVASRLSSAAHLEDILTNSLDALLQVSDAVAGGIHVLKEKTWSLAIGHGSPEGTPLARSEIPQTDPWVSRVLAGSEARLHFEDSTEGRRDQGQSGLAHSCLSLPCLVKGEAVAIVSLISPKQEGFHPETVSLLRAAATQVGMALERGRLLDQAERRLRERELLLQTVQGVARELDLDALLPYIISAAMQAIPPAERGTLHLYDREKDALVVRASVGFDPQLWDSLSYRVGEGCIGWVYLHEKPVLIADALSDPRHIRATLPEILETQSGVCAPLVTQSGGIGTLSLDNSSRSEAFDENDLRLLTAFASSAAVAIEHARALQEAHRLAAESGMLLVIGQLLASSPELDQVLQHIADEGAGLLRADGCAVSLYEPGSDTLTLRAAEGFEARRFDAESPEPHGGSEAREALRGGLPVVLADRGTGVGVPHEIAILPGIESLLMVPLISRGAPIGSLVFFRTDDRRPFTEHDKQLGMRLGHQSAISIENARLFASVNRSRQEWELTFNTIADAIFIVDERGTITQANESAATMLGTSVQDLVGRSYYRVLGGEDDPVPQCAIAETLKTGRPARAELQGLLLKGFFLVSAWPIPDSDGRIQGAVSILRDITVERQLRQQLLQAEKLSSLGQTIAGVAHELNNPLQTVVGYAQLLGARDHLDEDIQREVRRVHDAGQRAAGIVRNLLTFARKHEPLRELVDVNESIRAVLDLRLGQLQTRHISVSADLAADLPPCHADRHQLQQIWHNLILNAEQAMLTGGESGVLTVRSSLKNGRTVCVQFSDDGPGIPADVMGRIFDPFFTTKKSGQGTGLGLSVCYGIARAHGGQIWAESEEGHGARFIVELPAAKRGA